MTCFRDGCLTKVASEALRSVARMADASATSQQIDLGAYFTMAVQSDGRGVMTPVSSRPNSARPNGRWKVSNTGRNYYYYDQNVINMENRDVPDIHPVPGKCRVSHYSVLSGPGKIMGPSNKKKKFLLFFTRGINDPSGRQKLC